MQNPPELIGQAPAFLDALAHASAVAAVDRPVLIVGERGAGKELLAARMHFLSPRWDAPYVTVNCAAMNDELLESELFGHEAGSFTGAQKRHKGRFERADGGTLFLDEVASASSRVQEKLLRVIEYGEYERIGGEETLKADVRIVAAANVDLRAKSKTGDFRADLLDRLAFDVVVAPPLRARRADIMLLAAHFANNMAKELECDFPGFSPLAVETFHSHDWPGNVRELKNAAERAVFHWSAAGDTEQVEIIILDPFAKEGAPQSAAQHVAPPQAPSTGIEAVTRGADANSSLPKNLRDHLDAIEKEITLRALHIAGGNQKQAAKTLSLTYDQIRGIVRKYELAGHF